MSDAGASDNCSSCGHDRVFHQIGTGSGVPLGVAFCDDRHDVPCACVGFTQVGHRLPAIEGTFRLHFNRHGAAPLVWCVATDQFELAVRAVSITAPLVSMYHPKATPDDEDGKPSAWLQVTGVLELRGSCAFIRPQNEPTPADG